MIRDDKDIENLLIATTELLADYHFEEAHTSLLKLLEKDPKNLDAHYTLGMMYAKKNDYEKALYHLNKIIQSKKPVDYLNHVRIVVAYIYSLQNEYIKSKELLIKVLENEKNNYEALSILAYIFYKAKLYEQSLKIYQKLLNRDSQNARLLNNIGFILIETKLNLEKGIEYVKKALRIKPDVPSYLDSLGWGYYYQGDFENAIKTLKKAFELNPASQEIKSHIKEIMNVNAKKYRNLS